MTHSDGYDSDPTPRNPPRVPPDQEPTEPLHIQEATEPPVYREPVREPVDPTATIPAQQVPPNYVPPPHQVPPGGVAVPLATPDPRYDRERYLDEQRRGAWAVVAAVIALLVGGLVGFLIGRALDDDDDQAVITGDDPTDTVVVTVPAGAGVAETLDGLLERTRADGQYRTPSEYPQLDEIVAIDRAAATAELQNQVALLTEAQEDGAALTDRIAELEQQLTDVTAERDQLAAQVEESGEADSDTQAQLDAANEQIATLEAELGTARTELDTARAELQQAQADRDAAVAELEALNVMPVGNYVNGDVEQARADASANGWRLIEETVESDQAPGTVLEQVPPPNTDMISGSVLYVTVAGTV